MFDRLSIRQKLTAMMMLISGVVLLLASVAFVKFAPPSADDAGASVLDDDVVLLPPQAASTSVAAAARAVSPTARVFLIDNPPRDGVRALASGPRRPAGKKGCEARHLCVRPHDLTSSPCRVAHRLAKS